jgi:predicted XRE-type DNA-binding protein
MAKGKIDEVVIQSSTGNVFADLGLRDAGEKQTRVRLAVAINQIIEARHLSQTAAARVLEINQPKISALVNYRLDGFSSGAPDALSQRSGPRCRDRNK